MSHASSLAFDEIPRGAGGTGAAEHIAQVLSESGVDVPASLYDEALALARDGRLAPATERLRMLLVLDPSDAQAALLLGKVLAQRGLWQESLAQLDAAVAKGAVLPAGLRDEVEHHLRHQVQSSESQRARLDARAQEEIRALRHEAKKLRSESAVLEGQVEELTRRVKVWSSATALIGGASAALVLAAMVFGGGDAPAPGAAPAAVAAVEAPAAEPVGAAAGAPVEVAVAAPAGAPIEVPVAAPAAEVIEAPAPKPAAPAPKPAAKPAAKPEVKKASKPEAKKPAAAKLQGGKMHTVAKGETLGTIAQKYYGKSSEWKKIQQANREKLPSERDLQPGMKLRIP
jgi:LysM repeat protein/BMFP domain-containing protein YqiC